MALQSDTKVAPSGQPQAENRKRVAKNTLFLALRQLIVMAITLYTSRIVLEALGVVDYGVYNVVAGATYSFIFFSTSLSASTQRFLNFEMGRGNDAGVRRYFSLSLWTYLVLGGIVILVGSLFGPWLVYDVLVIPADSRTGALVVYYSMLVCLAITLVFSVYESVIIARENMKIYAYISILDAVLKLSIAFGVMFAPYKLITYGLLMVAALLVPKLVLAVYCYRKYPESRLERFWDKAMLKELLGFAGWNIYSGLVYIINDQGLNVVLNMYFGPVVNAARGIASQVHTAVMNFYTSFFTAVKPQIIKSYASRAFDEVLGLISFSTRTSVYLCWLLGLPVFLRTPQILGIWLTDVPEYAVSFVRWIILYGLAGTFPNPMQTLAQATGHLRKYSLLSMNTYLLAFPISVAAVMLGAPAWAVYPVLVSTRFLSTFVAIPVMRPYIEISFKWYILRVLGPIVPVAALSIVVSAFLDGICAFSFWGLALFGLTSVLTTSVLIVAFGLTRGERSSLVSKIGSFLSGRTPKNLGVGDR